MIGYLIASWKANGETLRDDREVSRADLTKVYAPIMIGAAMLAWSAGEPSTEVMSGVLTAFAIVAGFTFSALLFFVDHRFLVTVDPDSREQKMLQERVDRLADNLFININYFNLVCVALIVVSVVGLIRPPLSFLTGREIASDDTLSYILVLTYGTGFYALVIEAVFTFLRLLERLRYLFDKVRESHKNARS